MSITALRILRSFAALSLLSISALPLLAQDAPLKIAVVDLDLIVSESPAGKALEAKLQDFQKQARAEFDAMNEKARGIRQRLTDGANSLAPEELANLQKQFEDEQLKIRRLGDDKTREGQKMQSEGLQQIEKQLEPIFQSIRDENGYDLILNRVPGVVVMVGERIDITQKVIDRINAP
ncbi:MAG: OmpH family outer membrane protein [Thermoanaerobaculia bacterium]|nr:OmpH family outer membrane protein [Thermoanaerobaculia bacterium]